MATNFKLIAIKLGDALKSTASVNSIKRTAEAVFQMPLVSHPQQAITSVRAQTAYDAVMTLAEQAIDDTVKVELLERFIQEMTPPDSPLRSMTGSGKQPEGDFWKLLNPRVVKVAGAKFRDGYYADAVESALKDVNRRVKDHVRTVCGQEYDGADLMNRAFSPKSPMIVLGDLQTESGRSEQMGYMQIFAGAMMGIRNPKAHDNLVIDARRAIHHLHLASLLMDKLDEAKVV